MLKLIIFDLDGTLVNAYPAVSRSVNYVLASLGFPKRSHEDIKRAVGFGDRHLMAQYVGEQLADRAIRLYRPHHVKSLQARGGVCFLPGSKALLASLKAQGYYLAIASNRPTRFTRIILKVLGMKGMFDIVLCGDKAKRPKPYPDMLLEIIQQLKVAKKETLYVGDMTVDIKTGARAGIKTVAVATGSSSRKELKYLNPYAIIDRINKLKNIIKRACPSLGHARYGICHSINRSCYE